ncbi:zinc metallopeptidase [Peptoniphilus stercorisuis]|uniref:Zn-dependent membrane protease YugP n=1 Tax=Peptoniphilus stercorisuis TaxID=1436965 RepID=A0ABS4KGT9_9FIRM|nr:zinc metallopeptidase [Peptoniphilus stercorisuis]MBP2025849.1 Zn-dependent membrane protease YugP [Peptoniphilus stercorisuis]
MYYGYGLSYIQYILPGLIIAFIAQAKISSAYAKNKKISSGTGLTGAEAAKVIMDRNNLGDVTIRTVQGELTDHYNPQDKTLNLSREVYYGDSIASLSIAAHEVGHALQHQTGYAPLKIRAMLVPAANLGSNLSMFFIMLGLFFSTFFVKVGIAMFSLAVLFQIVTLPVEFNASRRAELELSNGIMPSEKIIGTREVLSAAALTYVASTLMSIGQLLRLLALFGNRRDRD